MRTPILAALCLLTALACGGPTKDPAVGKSRADHATGSDALPSAYRNQVPALIDAAVLNFLPDTTVAAWFVRSPSELATALEFNAILAEYRSFYIEAAAQLSTPSGANLLAPSTWSKLGIDAKRAAGVALLLNDDATGVFFVTLANKELFRTGLEAFAAKVGLGSLVAANAGESTIYVFQKMDEVAILVRGDVAMLVIPDRDDDLEKVVLQLSGTGSQPSLASSGRVAKAFAGFDHGKDMAGFIAFDTMIGMLVGKQEETREFFQNDRETPQDRLAQARASGASPDEIARLEEEVKDEERWRRRELAQNRLIEETFGAAGTVAVGVQLDKGTTRVRAQVTPRTRALLSRLFTKAKRPSAMPTRLVEPPLFQLGGQVDPATARELFHLLLEADGESPEEFADEMKKAIGIHPDEVIALFEGEVSGALTLHAAGLAGYLDQEDAMGLHLLARLKDPLAARALLDTLCASPKMALFVRVHEGHKALELPSWSDRKIRLEITGDYLQARSISTATEALAWHPVEKELLEDSSAVATMLVDPTLLGWLTLSSSPGYLSRYASDSDTPEKAKIRKELIELHKERAQYQVERIMSARDAVGRLVVAARPHAGGLAVLGTFASESKNLGRSLQSLIESMVPEVAEQRAAPDPKRIKLEKRIRELEEALWR